MNSFAGGNHIGFTRSIIIGGGGGGGGAEEVTSIDFYRT